MRYVRTPNQVNQINDFTTFKYQKLKSDFFNSLTSYKQGELIKCVMYYDIKYVKTQSYHHFMRTMGLAVENCLILRHDVRISNFT